jgi:hypothetical protein
MKPRITMRKALDDPNLFAKVLDGESWTTWRVILMAAMGEQLTDEERAIFTQFTSRATEPLTRCEELVAIVGRRGGKTRVIGVLAVYIAALVDHTDVLAAGETGMMLLIAQSQNTAAVALNYATAIFGNSPILRQLIANRTADALKLTNGNTIEVRTASFRRLRGPTYIGCIADECAFWMTDESANPDVEILNAVRPGLSTTRGPLIIASSPYAKKGILWDAFRRHYGPDGDKLILVARGASRDFNPSLPQSVVDRALERDREANTAEYLAEFRSDISTFVSYEIVGGCVGDHVEMSPLDGNRYYAFVDPSGGSADSFTLAISHRDGERVVIDATREIRPPFSPEAIVDEFTSLLKSYRITHVRGDRYAGEWPREQFRKRSIGYTCSEKTKSDLFRDLLPMLNSGSIVLPKSDRLVSQLCGLERRTSRSGKDSIDHGPGQHDDLANAVAGAADCAVKRSQPQAVFGYYGTYTPPPKPTRLQEEMAAAVPPCLIDFQQRKISDGR